MAKSGGLFECEYCGMQYDKTRIQEMVQEIKGTVKVEGTVEVTGTVKVEGNVSVQNFLKRGQMALSDNKRLEADAFFNDALNIDSGCAQAYLGKLFCELRVSQIDHLKGRQFPSIPVKTTKKSAVLEMHKQNNSCKSAMSKHKKYGRRIKSELYLLRE